MNTLQKSTSMFRSFFERYIYHIITLIFSIVYQIPNWPNIFESIYGYSMIDRSVYTKRLLGYLFVTDRIFYFNIIDYFTKDWLWSTVLVYMNRSLNLSPDQIFFIITTFVLWRFSFAVASRSGWVYVFLLINPLVVDFAFSQLRLALAVAILSIFWSRRQGKFVTILVYTVCTSIHTATVLFAIIYAGARYFSAPTRKNMVILCAIGFGISIMIGPWRDVILSYIGDRRAEYQNMESSNSFLSFWIIMFVLLICMWRYTMKDVDSRYSIIILSIVTTNFFTGGYSTRFIAAAFPSILIAMDKWPSRPVNLLTLLFLPYAFLQWLNWLNLV